MIRNLLLVPLMLVPGLVLADDPPESKPEPTATEAQAANDPAEAKPDPSAAEAQAKEAQAKKDEEAKLLSGMSILGNQDAPKSLVIVPWKSSQLGVSLGISPMLDDSRQPIDKEVFMRALSYYEIRSGRK